ncbi:MAG: dihydropteroate synthase [Pirellulales bacterium]|nr:dihydropteroate synthase [Pirellulales bacterium]
MGILNVTPDSFSDGGKFIDPVTAVEHGRRLAAEGADIIDVGGQSTRPGSIRVDADEELRRVLPVVESLCRELDLPVSIDTYHAVVARESVAAGAEIINDVTALTGDAAMPVAAATSGAGVCLMHMQGTPATMQNDPQYDDVVDDVYAYLAGRCDAATKAGIEVERIAIDPGIGFGKTTEHNLALLRAVDRFHELGRPLLIGHSRKGFIGRMLNDMDADRTAGTIGVSLAMCLAGVEILRVHDVAAVRQAIELFAVSRSSPLKNTS